MTDVVKQLVTRMVLCQLILETNTGAYNNWETWNGFEIYFSRENMILSSQQSFNWKFIA